MTAEKFKRKLTAILSADVKGYSRLMGADEEATHPHPAGIQGGDGQQSSSTTGDGSWVTAGDSVLAEFASVVDAVQCAVEIQQVLRARNKDLLPEDRRMDFRIGINLGDVIEEGDTIYGDGVNIAARLESLAEAGGICISGTVYEQIKNKLALGYEYVGEQDGQRTSRSQCRVLSGLPDGAWGPNACGGVWRSLPRRRWPSPCPTCLLSPCWPSTT